jgi:hypothetical protein
MVVVRPTAFDVHIWTENVSVRLSLSV